MLDTSVRNQVYIEDCEVCCKPIEIRYSVIDEEVSSFQASVLG